LVELDYHSFRLYSTRCILVPNEHVPYQDFWIALVQSRNERRVSLSVALTIVSREKEFLFSPLPFAISGPGCPTPYRLYVDSGVVLMCITSLAPVCPLIAPATMVYFGVCQPMLRWLLMFVFNPKYDGGGEKWPQLHQIIISSLILGQVSLRISIPFPMSLASPHGMVLLFSFPHRIVSNFRF
jgi:hypothetical protein